MDEWWTAMYVEYALRENVLKSARLLQSGDIEAEYISLFRGLHLRAKALFKSGNKAFDTLTHYTGALVPGELLDLSEICQSAKANEGLSFSTQCLQDGLEKYEFKAIERLENGDTRLYWTDIPGAFINFPSTSEQCQFLLEKLGPIKPGCKIVLISSLENS